MIDLIRDSVEIKNWGWNVQTVGAIGTVISTTFQGWGFWKQSQSIWNKESGESVSVPMTGFWLVYFCAFLIYALDVPSIAMVWNCVLGIPIAAALLGLWRFKKRKVREWGILLLSCLFIPAMIYLPKEMVLLAIFAVAYVMLIHQGYEVWKNGIGVLDSTFLIIFLFSGLFWLIFTAATGQRVIMYFQLLAIPIWGYIFWKWYRTRVPV